MSNPNPTGIERQVCIDIANRQQMGLKKYGQTVADNPCSTKQWHQHLYEELMDAAIYTKKLIADMDEKVLCIPRGHLESLTTTPIHGITTEVDRFFPSIITPGNFLFVPRCLAEDDPGFKQLIPYILVVTKSGKILRYKRGKKGEENRLHDLFSIGVGGHINERDFNGALTYSNALVRELNEEIGLEVDSSKLPPPVAIVNHDDTDVAKVHVGAVHVLQIEDRTASSMLVYCDHLAIPEFIPIAELQSGGATYEGWSAFCINNLEAIIRKTNLI